jgi:hypothetical protein
MPANHAKTTTRQDIVVFVVAFLLQTLPLSVGKGRQGL